MEHGHLQDGARGVELLGQLVGLGSVEVAVRVGLFQGDPVGAFDLVVGFGQHLWGCAFALLARHPYLLNLTSLCTYLWFGASLIATLTSLHPEEAKRGVNILGVDIVVVVGWLGRLRLLRGRLRTDVGRVPERQDVLTREVVEVREHDEARARAGDR